MEEKLKQIKSDCKKVVLYGPESTGKTTLSIELAKHFKTNWVQNMLENIYKMFGIMKKGYVSLKYFTHCYWSNEIRK